MKICGLFILLALTSPAGAHDHWINHGGYMSPVQAEAPYTGPTKCCGKGDCFLEKAEDVKGGSQGWTLANGFFMAYTDTFDSEDGNFWGCWNFDAEGRRVKLKCFFAPQPGT